MILPRALRQDCRKVERNYKKDKLHVSFDILWNCLVELKHSIFQI